MIVNSESASKAGAAALRESDFEKPRGLFAFSVEGLEGGSYKLQPTGRYAQSPGYLRSLAALEGLEERSLEPTLVRREGRGHAEGWLALFAKASGRATTAA